MPSDARTENKPIALDNFDHARSHRPVRRLSIRPNQSRPRKAPPRDNAGR